MAKYIANAFSLSMIPNGGNIRVECLTKEQASLFMKEALAYKDYGYEVKSFVGHTDTAAIFSEELGVDVQMNRGNLSLKPEDYVLVGQYSGPRLAEGTKTLPEGAKIDWKLVLYRW